MASKLVKSSALLVVMRFFQRTLGLISTLILARILLPADFGIIAIAALVIHFADIFSNTGIQQYVVQKTALDDEDVNSAWTLDILLKGGMTLLLLTSAPLLAHWYDNPSIGQAVAVLSSAILLRAFMNPGLHILRRNLEYRAIFYLQLGQKALSFMAVIMVALLYQSFWAIVVGDLVSALVGVVMSYAVSRYRPRFSRQRMATQWQFSKWMLSRGFIGYARAQVDVFIVSRLFPLALLGQYNLSRELTVMPANDVIVPAVEPLIAAFAQVKNDTVALLYQLQVALLAIVLFIAPVCVFMFLYADAIVALLLGPQWAAAAEIMRWLTILLFGFSLGGVLNNFCFALGRVKTVFYYDVASLLVIAATLLLMPIGSIEDFALLRGVLAVLTTGAFLGWLLHVFQAPVWPVLGGIFTPLSAAVLSGFVAQQLYQGTHWLGAGIAGVAFVLVYMALILGCARLLRGRIPAFAWLNTALAQQVNQRFRRVKKQAEVSG